MDLREAQKRTAEVIREAEKGAGTKMEMNARFIDLVEEVGELANAILIDSKKRPEGRRRSDFKDAVCDILFDLLALAELSGMDLTKEYGNVLEEMSRKIREGEFDG